ncbi:MAG: DnaJ domain-containing protein [Candidatus Omnitrophota bacterium]
MNFQKQKFHTFFRVLAMSILVPFVFSVVCPAAFTPAFAQTVLNLPAPGTMISPSPGYNPATIVGMTVHPDDPFLFDFIVHPGDDKLEGENLQRESLKMVRYFMAALTVPEDEMWVNLSPYEKDRIVPVGFGDTEMGRDLLAQDYILKQMTASLMHPGEKSGSEFWTRIREKVREKFGTNEIPVNTFNKVWIVPDKATVYASGSRVFVVDSHYKVMLEQDYFAMKSHSGSSENGKNLAVHGESGNERADELSKKITREIILPAIEREINEGRTFANLRQISNAVILATWYKRHVVGGALELFYADKNKTAGISNGDKEITEKIYNQYVESFRKGVYHFIREEYDETTREVIPREYFSGGVVQKIADMDTAGDMGELEETIRGSSEFQIRFDPVRVKEDGQDAAMLTSEEVARMLEESNQDYYSRLGVDKSADKAAIKAAYRKLIMKWHPDKNGDTSGDLKDSFTEIAQNLSEAWEILQDEERRKIYDEGGLGRGAAGFGQEEDFNFDEFFSQYRWKAPRTLDEILRDLDSDNKKVSFQSLGEIEKMIREERWHEFSPESVEEVKNLIASIKRIKDGHVRMRAVEALGRVARKEFVTLSGGLGRWNNYEGDQEETPQTLATNGLIEILQTDDDPSVSYSSVNTLAEIGGVTATEALVRNVNHPHSATQKLIRWVLIALGNNTAYPGKETSRLTVRLLNKSLLFGKRQIQAAVKNILDEIREEFKQPVDMTPRKMAITRVLGDLSNGWNDGREGRGTFKLHSPEYDDYNYMESLEFNIILYAEPFYQGEVEEVFKILDELKERFPALIVKFVEDEEITAFGLHLLGNDEALAHMNFRGKVEQWLRDRLEEVLTEEGMDGGTGDQDSAMLGDGGRADNFFQSGEDTKGGIDLNPAHIDIETKQADSKEIIFSLGSGVPFMDSIEGFQPVIIHVAPVTNIPGLLGRKEDPEEFSTKS